MESEDKDTERDIHDTGLIRDYLLCRLVDDAIIDSVERAQMTDDAYAATVDGVEEDIIEEYLEGTLDADEKKGFDLRLRNSDEFRQKVTLVRGLKEIAARSLNAAQPVPVRSSWGFPRISFAFRFAAVAAVVIVGALGWWYLVRPDEGELAYAQLQRSVAGRRIADGRTSIETTYSPLITTRGAGQPSPTPNREFLSARAALLKSAVDAPNDPAIRHAVGLMHLVEGDPAGAIAAMQEAEKLGSANAALLSDIGAAYLARSSASTASDEQRTRDQALALDYVDKALAADPTRIEALFNRAAILESLGTTLKAKEAWNNYLTEDPNSEWAAEARKRLERLERTTGGHSPGEVLNDFLAAYDANDHERAWKIVSETKELITGTAVFFQLAEGWLEAETQGRKDLAERNLAAMRYIGRLETERGGDKYFQDLSEYFVAVGDADMVRLAEARRLSALGYRSLDPPNWTTALENFESARTVFTDAGNVWEADLAEFQIGYVLTQLRRIDESVTRLQELDKKAQAKQYRWISSMANGWIASNFSLKGEHSTAIAFNKRSLELAEAVGDTLGTQKAIGQLTNQYVRLGNDPRVLEMIGRNISENPGYFLSPRQRSRNLLFASQGLWRSGNLAASAAFAEEQVVLARDVLQNQWLTHSAFLNLATIHARRGNHAAALAAAEECLLRASTFEDETMRRRLGVQSDLLYADVLREGGNCAEATGSYDRVIRDYGLHEFVTSLYSARKGRLLCSIEMGLSDQVVSEMEEIAALFEKNRRMIENEAQVNIFFDSEQVVYDAATEYAYAKMNDPALAFQYSESSRANALLTQIDSRSENIPPSGPIPDEVVVLYFSVLTDRTLVWAIDSEGSTAVSVPVGREELTAKVRAFSTSIHERAFSVEQSETLYELLIAPVWSKVGEKKVLCVIPDKSLFGLSFAALRSRDAGRFLVEDIALLYSPSLRVFDRLTAELKAKPAPPAELITAIGASQFDRSADPSLNRIPEADEEAKVVAAMYAERRVLTGKDAVRSDLWKSLSESTIVHFAGHFVSNKTEPGLSRLLLADGHITVDEVFRAGKAAPRLVVLSACESGVERYYAGEGMIGASRGFLAAGVPQVIGTHWAVDSAASGDLMAGFHRARTQSNLSAAEALRRAQIEKIQDPSEKQREPYFWAGFMPVGGYSSI